MNQAQKALIQKATESLAAASLLLDEGFYDFAISRTYYAMFYIAEAFLVGEGLDFSSHSAVIAAFGQHFAKTKRVPPEFHRYLIQAQDSRLIGDYDPSSQLTESSAVEHLERATAFLDLARQLLGKNDGETAV